MTVQWNIFLKKRQERNTSWIMHTFTQVKSAEHTAKFNIKSISNQGTFFSFSFTRMSKCTKRL